MHGRRIDLAVNAELHGRSNHFDIADSLTNVAQIAAMRETATEGMIRFVIGATTTGVTKIVNLGTGGASGSTTIVNVGSATAGAGGTTVVNTPTVTFANAVTQVGMPQTNLTT